ncbi:MAG: hypothetical protein ABR881_11890 [Candidatus Sulfotelmatobacter sp.]
MASIILFSDADLSSPLDQAPNLLEARETGADIAIGSQRTADAAPISGAAGVGKSLQPAAANGA